MSAPLIRVRDLVKEFRAVDRREGLRGAFLDLFSPSRRIVRAVDGVSFDVERGEMVGYIGPNGAGKSTTVKILTGILVPTSGEVVVAGLEPHADRKRHVRRIGVVFGQRTQLWWDIAVVESFRLLRKIYGVSDADFRTRLAELSSILELEPLLHVPVRKLSLGQRMRCDIAASLLHGPEILFLDEPTIGLDVVAKDGVRAFLKEVNSRLGTTVLLTTHDLRDIEELCRRILVIDRGQVIFDGGLDEVRERHAAETSVEFDFSRAADEAELRALVAGGRVRWERLAPLRWRATFDRRSLPVAEVISRTVPRIPVSDLSIAEPDIEDVVKKIYREGRA
jgi:ABC-2 type transport system ATP-binding protein